MFKVVRIDNIDCVDYNANNTPLNAVEIFFLNWINSSLIQSSVKSNSRTCCPQINTWLECHRWKINVVECFLCTQEEIVKYFWKKSVFLRKLLCNSVSSTDSELSRSSQGLNSFYCNSVNTITSMIKLFVILDKTCFINYIFGYEVYQNQGRFSVEIKMYNQR